MPQTRRHLTNFEQQILTQALADFEFNKAGYIIGAHECIRSLRRMIETDVIEIDTISYNQLKRS